MTQAEWIKAVREHALAHYNEGGWDFVVECYEDDQLWEAMGNAKTVQEAIVNVGCRVGVANEQRSMAVSEGGGCPDCLNFREHSLLCPSKGKWRLEEDE